MLPKSRRETSSNSHNGFIAVEREECEKERRKHRSCMANPQDSAQRCPFGCKGQGCHPGPGAPIVVFSPLLCSWMHRPALCASRRPLSTYYAPGSEPGLFVPRICWDLLVAFAQSRCAEPRRRQKAWSIALYWQLWGRACL